MEGKFELQFEDNEYYLVDGNTNDTVATTDKVLLKEYDGYMKKLSLKNCEDIDNGYDLIKLIEENSKYSEEDWGDGFLFAMNLMSDKKFSEKQMWNIFYFGDSLKNQIKSGKIENKHMGEIFDEYIQSLQQTEWNVEIEMEQYVKYVPKSLATVYPTGGVRPKLDADGCLILKRK